MAKIAVLSYLLTLTAYGGTLTFYSDQASFQGNDYFDWSQLKGVALGGFGSGCAVRITSANGITGTLRCGGISGRVGVGQSPSGSSFPAGDWLLTSGDGLMTITFDVPVYGLGMLVNGPAVSSTYQLTADTVGTALQHDFTDPAPAPFIGVRSTDAEITGLNSVYSPGWGGTFPYSIDRLVIATTPLPLSNAGSMAQLASGGSWTTTITLINTGSATAEARLNFFDNNGDPLQLPLTSPQNSFSPMTASTFTTTLDPIAELVIQSTGSTSQATQVGWAQLLTNGSIGGFAVFSQAVGNSLQEAVAPMESRNPGAFLLSFDNSGNYVTGVALANPSARPASVGFIIRDDTGAVLLSSTIRLPAQGHTSFVLPSSYVSSAGRRGTLEFDTPANGQISVLGLRFNSTGAFSTIPALTK